jgi:hypothetical protein
MWVSGEDAQAYSPGGRAKWLVEREVDGFSELKARKRL